MAEKFDVCIVGGGLIGLAIANQLARRKQKIVIVEKAENLATEASSNNGGSTWPFVQMLHEPHLYKMVRDGVEAHKRLCSSGLSYRYRMTPCNFTFFETGAMDGLIDRLETMPSTERFEILTRRELLESEPALTPAVVGGVRFPDCSLGEAGALCRELIREVVRAGVETRTSTEVVGLQRKTRRTSRQP
jgi:L-2-hydroxyglutarate oxidase LhgO